MGIDNCYKLDSPILTFLNYLDSNQIVYVSWKNNHELEDSLTGKSDLDIYIPLHLFNKFKTAAAKHFWLNVKNPIAIFPYVEHYYLSHNNGKIYHLHVYFKIVTGESWLKEYILPLDSLLIAERQRDKRFDIWVLNNKAQTYVFVLRHLFKAGALSSRLLYKNDINSYEEEWNNCRCDINELYNYGPIKLNKMVNVSGLGNDFELPKLLISYIFRIKMIPFLRIKFFLLPFYRLLSFVKRLNNKIFLKYKKTFSRNGMIIAISGIDGAGKTSMIMALNQSMASFFTVNCLSLGKPQGYIFESLRRILSNNKQLDNSSKNYNNSIPNRQSIKKSASTMVLSLLRLRKAKKAQNLAKKGHMVLVDRWPTNTIGMMDGPNKYINSNSKGIVSILNVIELWAYNSMPRADICFFLKVRVETALDRNRKRIKLDKETDDEIVDRHKRNIGFEPLANKTIQFDNTGSFEQKKTELFNVIWKEILKHQ